MIDKSFEEFVREKLVLLDELARSVLRISH
jgi:hypothetical protein